ncbi:carbohydrate ABC transporter permease [Microbacterium sediminis]|uniref:ABC transporter permease n=1 Tax=Microbacterium sediminis TaxID=904291 RepID=A0A1B9NA74_9MICO|nr:carbohydrate ABC transporter permease [Microbacterium sediminis]OCG73512.1 ABC transporter permease [Microbacterium sediminis]QBR73183.1 carbohydrate ABC transporter permease [Microbacterium sediminis]
MKTTAQRFSAGVVVTYIVLVALAAVYISPFVISVANSFKTDADATQNPMSLLPETFTWAAYERLFTGTDLPLSANSLVITIIVTICRVFFDSLAGYALSRLRFAGRQAVFAIFVGVMAVPSVVLMIPRFLVIKELGIYDTYAGMILPLLVDATGIFIMKQFFDSLPASIEEAARIDGAGVFRTFWSVTLPMATPSIITLTILSFQGSWNEFSHFVISRQSPELHTLTTGVGALVSGQLGSGNQFPLKLAAAVLMTIPVAIVFFLFQRRIMSTTEGAEKG